MKIIKNTYPKYPNVPHAEIGDSVHWEHGPSFNLIREVDGKTLFATAPVTRDGKLRSNGLQPVLVGVIAKIKSKNFVLEVK